jgi:hypothetical protein
MPATTLVRSGVISTLTKTFDLASPAGNLQLTSELSLANGTADGQADRAWGDTRSVVAGTPDDIDLAGVLEDIFGDVLTLAEVVAIHVEADLANTGNLTFGNHPTAAFVGPFGAAAHTHTLKPGDKHLWYSRSGWPVVATTADILRVISSAGTNAFSIIVVGRSA